MADTKISALTAATTPLAGTEVLPLVQSGVTKQVSVANLTAGRAVSADSLSLTNALTAANGGTGQSSYAVGDLLYASTTTALSKLADVATGNALISGGVGVAPSWGKIGLTTHVSGTLPVGNGGTGTSTAFTAGSVVFAGASGVYSQNNASFFWDNTNNRLGLGTTSPSRQLSVSGTTAYARLTDTDTAKSGSVEAALEFYASDGQKAVVGCPGNDDFLVNVVDNVNLRFFTNNTERQRIFASGGVSVGNTTDPGATNLSVTGSIQAGGASISGGAERVAIKTAGTSSATAGISLTNSAGTELFFIRSDGAFRTGSAAVSPYNNTLAASANCYINTDGTLLRATSSLKYKKDVQDAVYGLQDVLKLRAVTYKGKNEVDGQTVYGGLIAEEVHEAGLTQFVEYAVDGTPDALRYGNMASLFVNAIKELTARIEQLEKK